MHTVYLSLGSNLGNRKRLLHDAIGMIGEQWDAWSASRLS